MMSSPKYSVISHNRGQIRNRLYDFLTPYQYFCSECSFRTKRAGHLRRHMLLHDSGTTVLSCQNCSFKTLRANHLSRHKSQYHNAALEVSCKTERQKQTLNEESVRHRLIVQRRSKKKSAVPDRPFKCPLSGCKYRSSSKCGIRRHKSRHRAVGDDQSTSVSLVDKFTCHSCGYVTGSRELFLRHQSTVHSDVRPYLCDVCGCGFKRSDALKQHLVVHTHRSSRTYSHHCSICGWKFRNIVRCLAFICGFHFGQNTTRDNSKPID